MQKLQMKPIAAITPDANVKSTAKQAIADKVQAQKQQLMLITVQQQKKNAAKQQVQTEKRQLMQQ